MKNNNIKISIHKFGKIYIEIEDKQYLFNINTKNGSDNFDDFISGLNDIQQWHEMWMSTFSIFDDLIELANKNQLNSIKNTDKKYDVSFNYGMFFDEKDTEIIKNNLLSEYESEYGKKHKLEIIADKHISIIEIVSTSKKDIKNFILLFEKNHYKKLKKKILSTKIV